MKALLAAWIGLSAFFTATLLRADTIEDDHYAVTASYDGSYGVGQSFTATQTQLVSLGFGFEQLNFDTNATTTISLYQGSGNGGTLLKAVSMTLPASIPYIGQGQINPLIVDFDFAGVTLTPGSTYTFFANSTSDRYGISYDFQTDRYPGGHLFLPGTQNGDSVFRVVETTPEPSSIGLLAGAGLLLRRRVRFS